MSSNDQSSAFGVLGVAARRARRVAPLAGLAALFLACGTAPDGGGTGDGPAQDAELHGTQADGAQRLPGHLSPTWSRLPALGHVEGSMPVHLAIALPVRDAERLRTLARQVGDPESPMFRSFISHERVIDELAPSPADYEAVQRWARDAGLTVAGTVSNRLLVDVVGTAADVERAFHVGLEYAERPDGTRFFRPTQEPSIDLPVPILGVVGLDSYALPQHQGGTMPPGFTKWYGSSDVRNAYVSSCKGLTGAGQAVGVFSFDGYNKSDVTNWLSLNGITHVPTFDPVLFGTSTGKPSGTDFETVGDIEMTLAMAPGLSTVHVFMAPSDCSYWSTMITKATTMDYRTTLQFSSSYTCTPTSQAGYNAVVQAMGVFAAQGQSFYYPAGDSGGLASNGQWSDFPGMTVVGATSLTMNGNGVSYASELPWVDASIGEATGGGPEHGITIPSYQVGFATNGASSQYRNIPDVAIVGQNMFIVATYPNPGTYLGFEGTSAATPLWAGFTALANQQAATHNLARVGPANQMLYKVASTLTSGPYYPAFTDLKSGSVPSYWGSMGVPHSAGPGYDLVSGLGTPTCNLVYELVCAYRASNGMCLRATQCPSGQSWNGSACVTGTGGCFDAGHDCSSNSQCCSGLWCNTNNQEFVCTPPNCSARNLPCQLDSDCCSLSCDPDAGFCN